MEKTVLLVIIGATLVNYLPRMIPLVVLSRVNLPPLVASWLAYVPIAVLAALVAPDIFMVKGQINVTLDNKNLLAALPAFLVAVKTKSLVYTLLTGMGTMALLNALL